MRLAKRNLSKLALLAIVSACPSPEEKVSPEVVDCRCWAFECVISGGQERDSLTASPALPDVVQGELQKDAADYLKHLPRRILLSGTVDQMIGGANTVLLSTSCLWVKGRVGHGVDLRVDV